MSRVGKSPIAVPPGVTVNIDKNEVSVKGPKGELKRWFNPDMAIVLEECLMKVTWPSDDRVHRSLHGLTRTLLANMVEGVTKGFEKGLEMLGVGFRAEKQGISLCSVLDSRIRLRLCLCRACIALEGENKIKVFGIDKETVGEMAAKIRAIPSARCV